MNEIIGAFIGGSLPTIRNRWGQAEGDKGRARSSSQVWKPEAMSAGAFAKGPHPTAEREGVIEDILGHGQRSLHAAGNNSRRRRPARCAKNGGLLFSEAEISAFERNRRRGPQAEVEPQGPSKVAE